MGRELSPVITQGFEPKSRGPTEQVRATLDGNGGFTPPFWRGKLAATPPSWRERIAPMPGSNPALHPVPTVNRRLSTVNFIGQSGCDAGL